MAAHERVLHALNFLTGKGIAYYPDSCDGRKGQAIEMLITGSAKNPEWNGMEPIGQLGPAPIILFILSTSYRPLVIYICCSTSRYSPT